MSSRSKSKRVPAEFSRPAKVGVTLLSLAAIVGGWNIIGRHDAAAVNADSVEPDLAILAPTATSTPWLTTVMLPTVAPIPTLQPLNPIFVADSAASDADGAVRDGAPWVGQVALPSLAPLPMLAPLPALPVMPAPPPPPPSNSSSSNSSGSSGNSSSSGKKSGGS